MTWRRTRTGVLELHFGRRGGRTVLTRDLQKPPLMIVRPFEQDGGALLAFIVNPTGGMLGGDHYEVRVTVGAGARAILLTQSAAKIQPSGDGEQATQSVHFRVEQGGRLEYYPERLIPFAASRYRQDLHAELAEEAQFSFVETYASGRVARGERLAFHQLASRTRVDVGGQLAYLDAFDLRPQSEPLRAPGLLEDHDYFAGGLFAGGSVPALLPEPGPHLACGLTAGGQVWLRALAARGPELDRAVTRARDSLRAHLFGAPPLLVRR